jgi:eukaryotic-like serine/threonine-protein kinase
MQTARQLAGIPSTRYDLASPNTSNEVDGISPNTSLSHYQILSKLGAGGMGEVYLAQDTKLDRKVALKILTADVAAKRDRMERFIREAKSAASLSHPNIAQIFEIGEQDGLNYIAMEFVDGVTLRDQIHQEHTDLRKLLRYLQHAAEGLAKAHAAGIVHRDLKPDNIMVTRDGHAKVLDFGLAKLIEPQLAEPNVNEDRAEVATAIMQQHSTPGVIMGTVGYMSPEQAQGKTNEIDGRSDVFSFGCILFETATGKKPFEGDSMIKSLHSLIYEPAPPIKDLNPAAPAGLQRIIRRCLAKDKEERYQTIKEVAIELKELRRELETNGDFETVIPPSSRGDTPTITDGTSTVHSPVSTVSSAEYLVNQIGRHKRGLLGALALVLVLAAAAVLLFFKLRSPAVASDSINSLAVLPFQNRSEDQDTDYLSDGLTESLIFRLSQIPGLKVSPTSSVMRFKGKEGDLAKVANELGVQAVMTGRLTKRGETFNITVELVDVKNNKSLWGEQYERKMADLMTTQREIAAAITQKLQMKLSGVGERMLTKQYTTSNDAYQHYLKGRHYWNKRDADDIRKAIDEFKAAVEKDPQFALAYVGLSDSYVLLPFYSGTASTEVLPQARSFAERALAIDDSLGEAHTSLGYVQMNLWNWADAEKELKRGLEISPNYATGHKWYGNYLSNLGRTEEAIREFQKAQELDPLSLIVSVNLAEIYLDSDPQAAVEQCNRALSLDPNWSYGRQLLSMAYLKQGHASEAVAEAEKSVELAKRASPALGILGYVYAQAGRRSGALAILKELEDKYAQKNAFAVDLARVHIGLGDKDKAFEWLSRDVQSRNSPLASWLTFPPLNSLRGDARYEDLLKQMGIR